MVDLKIDKIVYVKSTDETTFYYSDKKRSNSKREEHLKTIKGRPFKDMKPTVYNAEKLLLPLLF